MKNIKGEIIMKKKITLITSILLIIALAVTFTACGDKEATEPTTTEQASTTEPTTFEVPEIKDEPTTEETTEETTTEVETTKKPTYSYNSSSSSSNKGSSSSSKPASTTKAPSTTKASSNSGYGEKLDDGSIVVVTNANGGGVYIDADAGKGLGGHGDDSVYATDPDVIQAEKCTDRGNSN